MFWHNKSKLNKLRGLLILFSLFFILTLSACAHKKQLAAVQSDHFPVASKMGVAKKGGKIRIALETDTPFTGIFLSELADTQDDAEVAQPGAENLFDTDNNYNITNKGPARLKIDLQRKTATITVKKGVRWSDGQQVCAQDLAYAYEIIANPKTHSPHYNNNLNNIIGLKAYHQGRAANISGISLPDGAQGRTIVLHFNKMHPGMMRSGNGYFWESAVPYHYLAKVPFSALNKAKQVRLKPLFFGPYQLKRLLPGEETVWTPNKYYWRGQPKLKQITIRVLNPSSAAWALAHHQYDIINVVNSQWAQDQQVRGYRFLGQIPLAYSYLAFKVGKWDSRRGENVMNPHAKMRNRNLRQALIMALDIDKVQRGNTSGLSFAIPTLILRQFGPYYDASLTGYRQNFKKAEKLLDQAGYRRHGRWRQTPGGHKLVIHFAARTGSVGQANIIHQYLQAWHRLGLHVVLTDGQLLENNVFYEKLQRDDADIDMFEAAWMLSTVPAPNELYSRTASFNYSRFTSKRNDQLLAAMNSDQAFLDSYRIEQFHRWQRYMLKQAYVVPEASSYQITAVNHQLLNLSTKPALNNNGHPLWYQVGFAK